MKKTYTTPVAEIIVLEVHPLLDASGVSSPDQGIGYGGVDENAELDPESRVLYEKYRAWDDEEMDEQY